MVMELVKKGLKRCGSSSEVKVEEKRSARVSERPPRTTIDDGLEER